MAEENEGADDGSEVPLQDLADAVAERREGSGSRSTDTDRGSSRPADDSGEQPRTGFDAPLEELAAAIASRRAARSGTEQSEPDGLRDMASDAVQARKGGRAASRATVAVSEVMGAFTAGPHEDISPFLYTVHYLVTSAALLGSVAIYLATEFGLLPPQWWLLAMPPLTVGLIGALPVVSRWLGIWEPEELR